VKGVIGEQGEADLELENKRSNQSHHDKRAEDFRFSGCISKAIAELPRSPRRRVDRMQLIHVEEQQRGNNGEKARRVDDEAPAYTDRAHHNGGDGGANNPRDVDEHGVESHGIP
jgi:hypothetical protein